MLMAVPSGELNSEAQTDRHPLLMDRNADINGNEHVINIPRGNIASTSGSHGDNLSESEETGYVNAPSTSVPASISHTSTVSPIASNSRNNYLTRRGDNYGRRSRSPLNSGLWISVELVVNIAQILAAIIVLSVSRNEHPEAPLFEWIIGYTVGCIATLPHLYWRYIHRNGQVSEEDSQLPDTITQNNPVESSTYTAISVYQTTQQDNLHGNVAASHVGQNFLTTNSRINSLVDHFKMALDCFFAVWFVVGNVWIFGAHSSSGAPNLYKLCIVFLTFSCIGYAMPFILCALICCCLPCIISIMGFREDMTQNRGATTESINSLPTYKFKIKSQKSREPTEIDSENQGDGGIFAPGTDKERIISAEDAVCCICLAKYVDDDELRELPCAHFFHMDCVDKWLKINALCPLCKAEVGNNAASLSTTTVGRHNSDSRVGNGAT